MHEESRACQRESGRAKRFAKVGGEMVSLAAVEGYVSALWPEHAHAVVSLPDARKGEQLVLLTDKPDATREAILAYARSEGSSELAVPRHVVLDATDPAPRQRQDRLRRGESARRRARVPAAASG